MSQPERTKVIKVRVSDAEHQRLQALASRPELARWMREHCLGADTGTRRRGDPPPADPALLRQLAGIGNNVNQIARRLNAGEWGPADRIQVVAALSAVSRSLDALRARETDSGREAAE